MFVRRCKSIIESEPSSNEKVVRFPRKVRNHIVSISSSENGDAYVDEDLEELLEDLATEEEDKQTDNVGSSDNIQWKDFTGKSGFLVELPSNITAVMETNRVRG